MISLKNVVQTASSYVRRRPHDGLRMLRGFFALRFALPIDALRWGLDQFSGSHIRDIALREIPPGLRFVASLETMGTPIRAGATITVDKVTLSPTQFRVELLLQQVELELLDQNTETSVAMLIKSGALDLSQPANLIAHLPKKPPFVVEAAGDRVVLELLRYPQFERSNRLKRWLPVAAQLCSIKSLKVSDGFIELSLGLMPTGINALRGRLLRL